MGSMKEEDINMDSDEEGAESLLSDESEVEDVGTLTEEGEERKKAKN